MIALLWFFLSLLASPFKSKSRLEERGASTSADHIAAKDARSCRPIKAAPSEYSSFC